METWKCHYYNRNFGTISSHLIKTQASLIVTIHVQHRLAPLAFLCLSLLPNHNAVVVLVIATVLEPSHPCAEVCFGVFVSVGGCAQTLGKLCVDDLAEVCACVR